MQPPISRPWLLWPTVVYVNLLSLAAQVIWVRKLTLLFGSTAFVLSAVLSVFLLGLAIGARLGGRWTGAGTPLLPRLVALVAAIGALCLVSLPLIDLGRRVWSVLAPHGAHPAIGAMLKLVVVLVVLLPPTLAIGASLPLLAELQGRRSGRVGESLALVYALDTLGGAAGALLAGLVLVPHLGLRVSSWILGGGAWLLAATLHRWGEEPPAVTPAPLPSPVRAKRPGRGARRGEGSPAVSVTLVALVLSGATAMLLETGYGRLFALLNGTGIAPLSCVLAGFLAGNGLGSLLASRRAESIRELPIVLAYLQLAAAASGTLLLRVAPLYESVYLGWFAWASDERSFFPGVWALVFILVAVATLAMGASFPLAVRWLAASASTDRTSSVSAGAGTPLGRAYFVNTLGAAAGALAGEYLLLPILGFDGLGMAAVVAYLATATLFLSQASAASRRVHLRWVAPLVVVALLLSPGVRGYRLPTAAVYYHGVRAGGLAAFRLAEDAFRTAWQRQGYYGHVAVVGWPELGVLYLRNNGKTDASTMPTDNYAQLLLAHLPLVLHPDPRRVLDVGLGGGITLGAILRHPVREVDQVEIDPLVVEAARRYFGVANRRALDDPRVRLLIDDGRRVVDRNGPLYDVIVSEPPNIWIAGVSGLFTREYYAAVRRRLAPGGLLSQWLPVSELREADFHTALRTVAAELPHLAVWTNGGDAIVVAGAAPLPFDRDRLGARASIPGLGDDFAAVGIPAASLVRYVEAPRFRGAETLAHAAGGELNTDDLPVLEFRSLRALAHYAKTAGRDHWLAARSGPG